MLKFIYEKEFATLCLVICIFSNEVLGNSDAVTNCTCGPINNHHSRIVGGIEAEENEFSWQAAVYYWKKFFCSASIINNLYLLTAAHCFKRFRVKKDILVFNVTNISAVLGVHQREEFSKYKEVRQIIQAIIHEKYRPCNHSNDIALIKMKEPLTRYTSTINPICLPPSGRKFENILATVSGWGYEKKKGSAVANLKKTNVTILSNFLCNKKISKYFSEDIMMCADSFNSQTCKGDSGGPLMIINGSDKFVQIGVVSFGFGCPTRFFPHLYTRVNHYLQWIQNHTSDAAYCKN
ncbi:UNVERIFIED_CONTAM: hypothetical protein RMT77_003294 [Armadillidium vulgare]